MHPLKLPSFDDLFNQEADGLLDAGLSPLVTRRPDWDDPYVMMHSSGMFISRANYSSMDCNNAYQRVYKLPEASDVHAQKLSPRWIHAFLW